MEHESALPKGFRFDEYEIVRVLGAGGFGITYLGYDHNLDKPVAIKEYLPNDLALRKGNTSVVAKSSVDQGDFAWGMERFLAEARALAQFDHPNIPKVHRFFEAHGTGYIVMEYVEGETLSAHYKKRGSLPQEELKKIVLPLLEGLETIHATGYLHRDIKPANIVLRDDGSPVLIDFGSARAAIGAKSRSVTSIITPGYAPIEQYSTKGNQGPWTDIYALGAVLYRGLSGKTPDDATERLLNDELPPLAAARTSSGDDDAFLSAIDWALQLRDTERPQNCKQWRNRLVGENGGLVNEARACLRETEAQHKAQQAEIKRKAQEAEAQNRNAKDYSNSMGMSFKNIPAGSFYMGSGKFTEADIEENKKREFMGLPVQGADCPSGEITDNDAANHELSLIARIFKWFNQTTDNDASDNELLHKVHIRGFQMGVYQVTLGQFKQFIADADRDDLLIDDFMRYNQDTDHPVVEVSWEDTQAFIAWLNKKEGGNAYRLPTEAEWEYAARAGTTSKYSWGDSDSQADDYAWYDDNSGGSTHAVGGKRANPWGLYDMHGNVWEWVQDWYADDYYANSPSSDPQGPDSGWGRVYRGGGWLYSARCLRSALRFNGSPGYRLGNLGFRLVRQP